MRLVTLFVSTFVSTLAVAMTACGSPQTAPIAGHTDKPAAPTTPAPSVTWIDNGFDVSLLPAVSADGASVVVAQIDNDGGRGNPNLKLLVKDRGDKVTKSFVVLTVDEAETFFEPGGKRPRVDERIAKANAWLADVHASTNLVPLAKLASQQDPDAGFGEQHRAVDGDLVVDWKASKLAITRAGKSLVTRATPGAWLSKPHKPCQGCDVCENPEFLEAAAVDATRAIAVITVGYTGNDTCWEPPVEHHVVTW